jgi:hypothetical protein
VTSGKPSTLSDLLWAALLAVFGLFLAIDVPLAWGPPSMGELVPAEGHLLRYSLYREGGRSNTLFALIKLDGYPGRFWNDALEDGNANLLRGDEGSIVRVLYVPHPYFTPKAGDAFKSWGLWVNGVEIRSAARALDEDRFFANVVLPLFGVGFVVFGCVRVQKIRRELARRDEESATFPAAPLDTIRPICRPCAARKAPATDVTSARDCRPDCAGSHRHQG